jgi:hypothetical protein
MSEKAKLPSPAKMFGVMAEYATPRDLMHATVELREKGWTRMEAYSPFPVHGIDVALGHGGSKIPWIILICGLSGAGGGLLLQWWTSAVAYPIWIAGKPLFSLPAFVPITFELGVLLAAFSALLGMLALNKLPKPYDPVFKHSRFSRVTDDRFFLAIEAKDPLFDVAGAEKALADAGGTYVEVLEA